MSETQIYRLTGGGQHQIKIKASRFLADAFPISHEDDVPAFLTQVRKREYTANHHCYAWRLGSGDDEKWKVSDDGEPAGTAGQPIYQVLKGQNLTGVLVVVTRYFGGTKLGKGGLIRAYGGVVQELLPGLPKQAFIPKTILVCDCDFEHANLVYRMIETFGAELENQDYSDRVRIQLKIKQTDADKFAWELHELSQGIIKAIPKSNSL